MRPENLRCCPFCGSEDVKDQAKRQGDARVVFIQCRRCNAKSGAVRSLAGEPYDATVAIAAERWNRRAAGGSQA